MRRDRPVVGPQEHLAVASYDHLGHSGRRRPGGDRLVRSVLAYAQADLACFQVDAVHNPFCVDPVLEAVGTVEVHPALPPLFHGVNIVAPSKSQAATLHSLR